MQLLDGKATSDQLKKEIADKVAAIKQAGGKVPHAGNGAEDFALRALAHAGRAEEKQCIVPVRHGGQYRGTGQGTGGWGHSGKRQ